MRLREGTNDAKILQAVFCENEYHVPEKFAETDIVLDIGGHIGTFAVLCAQKGANVVSVEPSSTNFSLFLENVKEFQHKIIPIRAAVVGTPGFGSRFLDDCPNADEPSGHSIFLNHSGTGEQVPTIDFDSIVAMVGDIRFCKLDCEGAEYGILRGSTTLRRVKEFAMELHDAVPFKVNEIAEVMKRNGFHILWKKEREPFVLLGWERID